MLYPPSSLIATAILFMVISIGLTALRFWVRLRFSHTKIGLDDWFITIATVVVVGLDAVQIVNTVAGSLSRNSADAKAVSIGRQIDYAQVVVEKLAYGSIKLSFLFFYRRIFGIWPRFRKFNNALIILIVVWTILYTFIEIFQCGTRPQVTWNQVEIADQVCINHGGFLVSFAVTDVIQDIMVISLPLFYVGRLQMGRRQRWATTGVFVMGFFSTAAGILRLVFVCVNYSLNQFLFNAPPLSSPLRINEAISPIFWTNFECFCGVVAANLLPLWPLIRTAPKAGSYALQAAKKFSVSHVEHDDSTQGTSQRKGTNASATSDPGPLSPIVTVFSR